MVSGELLRGVVRFPRAMEDFLQDQKHGHDLEDGGREEPP